MSVPIFDDDNIISEHGTMAVTYQGMAHIDGYAFFVDRDELWGVEYESFSHMYPWLDETDFDAALAAARDYHVSRTYAQEQADEEERGYRKDRLENSYAYVDKRNGYGTLRVSFETGGEPLEGVVATLTDNEDGIDYSQQETADVDGECFFPNLPLLADNADTTYTVTVNTVPDGYTVPAAAGVEVVHGGVTDTTVAVAAA